MGDDHARQLALTEPHRSPREDVDSALVENPPPSLDLDDSVAWVELMVDLHDMNTSDPESSHDQPMHHEADTIKAEIPLEKREKLTCAERRKRETRELRVQIEQLQNQLARLTSQRQTAFALTQETWGVHIDAQICSKAKARHRNAHLRRAMAQEKNICMKLKMLLRKMIAPMEVIMSNATPMQTLDSRWVNAFVQRRRHSSSGSQEVS